MNIQANILTTSEISFIAKAFLHTAASCCSRYQNEIWHSQPTLAKMMSCSVRTVQRAVRELLELKLISVKRRWLRSNVYTVHCLVEPRVINNDDTVAQRTNSLFRNNDRSRNAVDIYPIRQEQDTGIVGEIEAILNSNKDRDFWLKVTRKCSPDAVRAAISSLKIALNEQVVRKPAAYLTAILKAEHGPGLFGGSNHQHNSEVVSPTAAAVEPLRPLSDDQWRDNMVGLKQVLARLRC